MTTTAIATVPIQSGTYALDPDHSSVAFQVRYLGLSSVRGVFRAVDATLSVGDTLADVAVSATIGMASVDTNQPDRDGHLCSPDFFDVAAYPQMTFRSTDLRELGNGRYALKGDLTLKGTTNPVVLDAEFHGVDVSPVDGNARAGFTATADIQRCDWGVDFNMPLGMGKLAISETVKVTLEVQFIAK